MYIEDIKNNRFGDELEVFLNKDELEVFLKCEMNRYTSIQLKNYLNRDIKSCLDELGMSNEDAMEWTTYETSTGEVKEQLVSE